jgi:hypothetical protein
VHPIFTDAIRQPHGAPMSTEPLPAKRYALKLPAGSVRAIHVLAIVGLICAIILIPGNHTIPPYLIYLLFLILGHYFAAHGVTIATRDDPAPSPLYLPGGVVRFVIVAALVGCIGWKLYDNPQGMIDQFKASLDQLKIQPILPLVILGGFLFGITVRALLRRISPLPAFLDFEAWISIIAMIAIVTAGMIHLVVDPSLEEKLYMPVWESFVGGVVAFYFGERS